jgi:membrane-bound metal-dependent hydrolase YbcI (DUF457 family)
MFVGHALIAFALVGAVAARLTDRRRALLLATVAGAFAAVPDVDIIYALVGVAGVVTETADPLRLARAFWRTGNVVHRAVTHSVVVAPFVAAAAAALVAARRRNRRPVGAAVLATAVVAVVTAVSGLLGGVIAVAFLGLALGIAELVARRTDLSARVTMAVALVGLATHPFGDLLTGQPPALLYPIPATVFAERVTLSADPTLHLLAAFAVELAAVWAGVSVFLRLTGRRGRVAPRAALGVGYAGSLLLIPAPTLDLSYPFVFSVVGLGLAGLFPRLRRVRDAAAFELPDRESALMTGLATVTIAWLAYSAAYVAWG